MPRRDRINLSTIAERLGVSVSTVSRALQARRPRPTPRVIVVVSGGVEI